MKVAEEELLWQIKSIAKVFMPARTTVEEAWKEREAFHSSGEYLYFKTPCPWKEHVFELEADTNSQGLIKFVFYADDRGMFRVQAMPPRNGSFDCRVPLS